MPISCQWNKNGYEYPIQIAQYGLSHYSKWVLLKNNNNLHTPLIVYDNTTDNDNIIHSILARNQKYLEFTKGEVFFHTSMTAAVKRLCYSIVFVRYCNFRTDFESFD